MYYPILELLLIPLAPIIILIALDAVLTWRGR